MPITATTTTPSEVTDAAAAWHRLVLSAPEAMPREAEALHVSVFFTPGDTQRCRVVTAATIGALRDLEALDALLLALTRRREAIVADWADDHGQDYFPGAYAVVGR